MSVTVLMALLPPLLQAAGLNRLVLGATRSGHDDPGGDRKPTGADGLKLEGQQRDGDDPRCDRELAGDDCLVLEGQHGDGGNFGDDLVLVPDATLKDRLGALARVIDEACNRETLHRSSCLSDGSVQDPEPRVRRRDVFPLPYSYAGGSPTSLILENAAIRGLNMLYGCQVPRTTPECSDWGT